MNKKEINKPVSISCMLLSVAMAVMLTFVWCNDYANEVSLVSILTIVGAISYYLIAYGIAKNLKRSQSSIYIPVYQVYMDKGNVFKGEHGFALTRGFFEELGDPMAAILFNDERMELLVNAIEKSLIEKYDINVDVLAQYLQWYYNSNLNDYEQDLFDTSNELIFNEIELTAIDYGMQYYEDFDEVENMALRAAIATT